MAKFSKKHYEVIADIILANLKNARVNDVYDDSEESRVTQIYHDFENAFRVDNPAFDADRFMEACGFQERAR